MAHLGDQASSDRGVPVSVSDAVLRPSLPMPDDTPPRPVVGIDFDRHAGQAPITVQELVSGMANVGFQATNLAEGVRIVNEMVRHISRRRGTQGAKRVLTGSRSGSVTGVIPPPDEAPPSSWATLPT